jgi:hypothetical protein
MKDIIWLFQYQFGMRCRTWHEIIFSFQRKIEPLVKNITILKFYNRRRGDIMEQKVVKNIAVIAFSILACYDVASAEEKKPDIIGVQLGMSPDEVRAALKKQDPNMKVLDFNQWQAKGGVPSSLAVIRGCTGGAPMDAGMGTCTDRIDVMFGQATKKAINISRDLEGKDQILVSNVISSLAEKYGPPTQQFSKNSSRFEWIYDVNGKPTAGTSSSEEGKCQAADIAPPSMINLNCGLAISATAVSLNTKYLHKLQVRMYDARLVKEERQTFSKLLQENDKNKVEILKNTKPKL